MSPTPSEIARAYHAVTKHQPQRQARSLGYMDWDNQPDPFRRYLGAAEVPLALGAGPAAARLLELSLGLSAWKRFEGNRWSLRMNPSSGNLHPTEGYIVSPGGEAQSGLPAGVLHYAPREHLLELRCSLGREAAARLAQLLPPGGFLVGLSSVLWREAWKYGERALRYCALDLGHALGALDYAAACVGLGIQRLDGWADGDVARLLGLDREADYRGLDRWDHELPELLLALTPAGVDARVPDPDALLEVLAAGTWHGQANALSEEHHEWDVIPATAAATERTERRPAAQVASSAAALPPLRAPRQPLEQLIRQRRSAVSMDAKAGLSLAAFAQLLDATLPRPDAPPFRCGAATPLAQLILFVHRVEGLTPGLYLLERGQERDAELLAALGPDLAVTPVDTLEPLGFGHLSLSLLRPGRCEGIARAISCQQDIAADSVFSLGMLARFAPVVEADASAYRRLHWECGQIGQALYLEAEAAGLRGTGIGCFFDDSLHQLLGLTDERWQCLYHFTVGAALDDARLETLPPYAHLAERGDGPRRQPPS